MYKKIIMMYRKVEAPKFLVFGEYLNEYEVRQLQVDVFEGLVEAGISVDENGIRYTIGVGGRFINGVPTGFSLSYNLVKKLLV